MRELKEKHQTGIISIENLSVNIGEIQKHQETKIIEGDFGIQIAPDGRVWICLNGVAFIRFKPQINLHLAGRTI